MRSSRFLALLLFPCLTLLGACGGGGGGGGSTGSGSGAGGQQAGSPGDNGGSEQGGSGSGGSGGSGENGGESGGSGGSGSGGSGGSGGEGSGGEGGESGGSGGEGGEGGEGGGSGGEGEGGSNVSAAVAAVEQETGRLDVTIEVEGTGEVTVVATEGDQSESVVVDEEGLRELSFRIPRRDEPLTVRPMTIEAFNDQGELLASEALTVIEPLDLPQHGLLSLNLVDQASLQTRTASKGRARNVLGAMQLRLEDALLDGLYVPPTKGLDGNGYRCPDHGDALERVTDAEHRCPADGHVFGPNNTDQEVYDAILGAYNSVLHRDLAVQAFEMGVAWVVAQDMRYAERAADILLEYSNHYLNYPLNDKKGRIEGRQTSRVLSQSLDEARWLINLARGLDAIRGSGALTQAEEQQVMDQLIGPSTELLRGKRTEYRYHNIQCWMNSAVFLGSLQLGDFEAAREALYGQYGLIDQLAHAKESDYLWSEGSFGYHYFAIRGMMPMLHAMRRAEIHEDDTVLREMMVAPLTLMNPDGSFPLVNDSAYKSLASNLADLYEMGAGLFNDREIAAPLAYYGRGNTVEGIVYGLKTIKGDGWSEPGTANLPKSGMAAMRSGTLASQTFAFVDYGPHGGDHGHNDKLSLNLWLNGEPVIREGGHIGYQDPWYKGWYKRSLAHSTILRDGVDQEELSESAEMLRFERASGTTTLEVVTDAAYPGSTLQRLIHTTANGRLIDLFEVSGNDVHTYDYVLHLEGSVSTDLSLTQASVGALGFGGAYTYLSVIYAAQTDDDFHVMLETAGGTKTVRVLGAPGTTVFLGEARGFPSNSKHPILIVRRTAQQSTFAMVATQGSGLPGGMELAHVANSRSLSYLEPEDGQTVNLILQ